MMLILCALVVSLVSAEDVSVLSDQQGVLAQGQSSRVYTVTLNCPGTATVVSNYGARFNIYAKQKTTYGSCPSASSLQYNYDKISYGKSGTNGITSMTLGTGVWCLMVYGYSESGSYSLRVISNCESPTPTPSQAPYHNPSTIPPCGVQKTDTRQGSLNQGQAAVYGYSIPNEGRSNIEWSMTSSGTCNNSDTPVIIATAGDSSTDRSSCTGNSGFDLYIFKDCNPKDTDCNTKYYSKGPNSYASVTAPSSGSIYYAMVYARSGSGTYNLKMNSYKCTVEQQDKNTIIIPTSTHVTAASETSNGARDTGSESEVTAPTAQFV